MKAIVSILCWILTAFCVVFPFVYTHSDQDKKEVKISHILVETQEKAQTVKDEIKNGKSFEDAAGEYSQCESKEKQGDIGYNMRNRLDKNFEKVAFAQNLKEVSEPVQTEEGWHLIKIYDVKYFSDKESFIQKKVVK